MKKERDTGGTSLLQVISSTLRGPPAHCCYRAADGDISSNLVTERIGGGDWATSHNGVMILRGPEGSSMALRYFHEDSVEWNRGCWLVSRIADVF